MGFYILRSMSATLVAFLMVMCCCSAQTSGGSTVTQAETALLEQLEGHYFSFSTWFGNPADVVDRYEIRREGENAVRYYRNCYVGCTQFVDSATATPMEIYVLEGHTLIGSESVTGTIADNGDIVYSHGYTSRKEAPRSGGSTFTTPADYSCQPNPFKCDSSILGDCCTARATSREERRCSPGWIPIYTGVLPLLRRCHSCVHPGKGLCFRPAALSTELLPRPCTVPHRKIMLGRQQRVHLLLGDMFGDSCG